MAQYHRLVHPVLGVPRTFFASVEYKKKAKPKLPDLRHLLSEVLLHRLQVFGMGLLGTLLIVMPFTWMGCQVSGSDKQVQIRLSTWGSAEEIAVIKNLIQDFESRHPQIQVNLLHIPENYFQKLHILIAGGLTPDVMFVNSLSFPVYAENSIFYSMDQWLDQSDTPLSRSMFFDQALKALSWKGKVYAIPRDVSNLVVYYNADLFRQAGLSPPSPRWTLEEMVALARQLTTDLDGNGTLDQFGISFYAKPPLFWLPFLWSQGGDLFSPDFQEFSLASPDAVKALQFYADLRHRWHVAPTLKDVGSTTMSQLFLQGKLAMMVGGRWSVPVLRQQARFEWDVVPFPHGKSGSVVGIDASGYAVSATTGHLKESLALVAFLSSREAQEAFNQSGLIVPARKDVAESRSFLSAPPEHGRYFVEVINQGYPTHVPERWNEIAEELNVALEPVWEGTQKAQDAIARVEPRIRKLLP